MADRGSILWLVLAGVSITAAPCAAEIVQGINMEFVTIGNSGNPGDTRTGTDAYGNRIANPYGCGAVDYEYQIGKYEVTNTQWDAFTAAAGAPTGNPSNAYDESAYWTGDNIPTNKASWYETVQFCNWLTSGDKSLGAYLFSGNNTNPGDFLGIDRDSAVSAYGIIYVLPTEDEWYKAAYYTGSGYSTYANGTDVAPVAGTDTNYDMPVGGSPWDVGTGTMEQNGTFDMMGNIREWNETLFGSTARGVSGGSYIIVGDFELGSSCRMLGYQHNEYYGTLGFRLAYIVPETIPVEMVLIPGSEFEMGDHFAEGNIDELPVHAVLVDSFFMSKFEITNQQYCDYLNSAYPGQIKVDIGIVYAASDSGNRYPFCDIHSFDPGSQIDFSDPDFSVRTKDGRDMSDDPMVEVSWYGAVAYCNWRSSHEGKEQCYNLSSWTCDYSKDGYRLPTEAEWEYAARGGEHNPYYRFGWGDTISHGQANYYACTSCYSYDVSSTEGFHPTWHDGIHPYTSIVGSFQANGYGLYDMTGNVWEWCNDWYDSNYYNASPYDNPEGSASGSGRVLRGGSWFDYAGGCRVAYRSNYDSPGFRYGSNGFRIVRDSEPTNLPPVADAGDDQIVYICGDGAAEIELDGSGSTDADGDELEYLWTWETEGALFDANGVNPIIELPVGLHTIELTVDDGTEVSEPNSCVIEVIEGIEVDLRVMPRVINRKSRMRRFLAVVQLPAGIDGDDIDGSFWLYPGEIEPLFHRLMTVNDSQKLFMVFDKSELMAAVPGNGAVVLEIEAQLISGRCLYGSDRIRIIRRGRGPREQTGLRKGTRSRRNRVQNSR